jgi:hypothetical protein
VIVTFLPRADSSDAPRAALDSLVARGNALALYRMAQPPPNDGGRLAIVYTRAACILIAMKRAPDGTSTVDWVRSVGDVDGVHLQPVAVAPDSGTTTRLRPPGIIPP